MAVPTADPFNLTRPSPTERANAPTADPALVTALAVAGFMALTILGTLAAGRAAAFTSLAMLAIAILYCAVSRPSQSLPLFIGYVALEGLYKYISGFSQAVYVVKPLLELSLLVGLLLANRQHGRALQAPPLAVLVGALAGWSIIEVFHPLGSGIAQGFGQIIVWYLAPMSLLWTGFNVVRSMRHLETLCYTLVAVSVVVSLFAIVQYQMGQAWTMAHLPGYSHVNQGEWTINDSTGAVTSVSWRPASTTVIGGGGALWAMWGSAVAMGLLLSDRINAAWKIVLLVSLSINAYGIILSGARLFLIVAIVQAMFLFVILARSPRELTRNLGAALAVAAMVWVGFTAAQTTSGGIITNRYAETLSNPLAKYGTDRGGVGGRAAILFNMLGPYPLGVGYQRGFEGAVTRSHAVVGYYVNRDDAFNSIAGDMGWPGLLLALCLVPAVLARCWRAFRCLATMHRRIIGGIFFALMIGYLTCFFGGPALTGADMFWLFLGLMLVQPIVQQRERLPNTPAERAAP